MTTTSSSDRIERQILLRAPRSRVWRAVATPKEFGKWFGVELEGTFEPGARAKGRVTHAGYEHLIWDVLIERVEPERLLSWHWHPHAIDPNVDLSGEPTTLVEFKLQDAPGGTLLTVVESGFDRLPAHRRDVAFRGNSGGWEHQMKAIESHVARNP